MTPEYSAEFLSAVEMEGLFDREFGQRLIPLEFERIGKRRWVRETHLGFKHYVFLNPVYHSFAYLPCAAVSCDYVPRIERGKPKLRRTIQHVEVHFSFNHNEYVGDWNNFVIHKYRSSAEREVEEVAKAIVANLLRWLESFISTKSLLVAFEREKEREIGERFYCYPMMALSYAFTLKMEGEAEAAMREFDRVIQSTHFEPEIHERLRELLKETHK